MACGGRVRASVRVPTQRQVSEYPSEPCMQTAPCTHRAGRRGLRLTPDQALLGPLPQHRLSAPTEPSQQVCSEPGACDGGRGCAWRGCAGASCIHRLLHHVYPGLRRVRAPCAHPGLPRPLQQNGLRPLGFPGCPSGEKLRQGSLRDWSAAKSDPFPAPAHPSSVPRGPRRVLAPPSSSPPCGSPNSPLVQDCPPGCCS